MTETGSQGQGKVDLVRVIGETPGGFEGLITWGRETNSLFPEGWGLKLETYPKRASSRLGVYNQKAVGRLLG